jgi:hypothetical protein
MLYTRTPKQSSRKQQNNTKTTKNTHTPHKEKTEEPHHTIFNFTNQRKKSLKRDQETYNLLFLLLLGQPPGTSKEGVDRQETYMGINILRTTQYSMVVSM